MSRQRVKTSYTSRQQVGTSADHRQRAYIEGNTVRKLDTLPERERQDHKRKEEKRRSDRAAKANRARAMQLNPGYILFLSFAVAVSVCVCVAYIQLQSDVNNRMKSLAALESQVLDLKTDNDAAEKRIETSINIDEVREKAINELGMVYPGKDQIVYFEVDEDDYMNQYQDIPEK